MGRVRHLWLRVICLWFLVAGTVYAQQDAQPIVLQLRQAQAMIESGKPEEAYAILAPLESQLAGNVEYDYLLGVSAVNSGKASQAVFAFERVQASDPDYKEIGLWLAIAYYDSGDYERAKSGFEAVLAQSRDAEVLGKAERYLGAIRQAESGRDEQASLLGKLEIGAGHDSNITNSPPGYATAPQIAAALPAPASNRGGAEAILNLGVEGRVPFSGHYVFASASDEKRNYSGHSVMNSDTVVAKGGVNFGQDGDTYKVDVAHRQFRQLGTFFAAAGLANDYDVRGLEGSARQKLSAKDYIGYVAQLNQLRFLANNTEDTNQVMLGANYMHLFQVQGSPVAYIGYARLNDMAVRQKNAYNPAYNDGTTVASRGTDIFTLYLQYSLSQKIDVVSTNYVYFRKDSGAFARDPVVDFGKDRTSFVSLGVIWRASPRWMLRSQLAKTVNNSNIALYSYSKTEATVILGREFN